MKQVIFVLAGTFISAFSFAQVSLGVANSTHAAIQNSINVGSATKAATNAAAHTAVATTNATRSTVSATTSKAADVKTSSSVAVKSTTEKAVKSIDVNAGARVNAQAETHASEQAKANANSNSAVFGAKTDDNTQVGTGANVHVNGNQAANGVQDQSEKAKTQVKTTINATKEKAAQTRVESSADLKSESEIKTQKQ